MRVELTYDRGTLPLIIDDSVTVDYYQTQPVTHTVGPDEFAKSLTENLVIERCTGKKILFIVNDAHRSTPTARILDWLFALAPDIMAQADFLVACGTHDAPDIVQYEKIFGSRYAEINSRVSYHDCRDRNNFTEIGIDQFDQPVFINSRIFGYEQLVIINSVEPHYFAGYTGGRKSFCPGLADFDTIERNHNLANSLECVPTRLLGNPMAEHLENILELAFAYSPLIKNALALQVVYDSQKTIGAISVGDIKAAFAEAVTLAESMYLHKTATPYDAVFMEILPPLDNSVYQAQKALENNQMAVADKGYAFVISACYDGIGSPHFFKLADNWDRETNQPKDGKKQFGSHKLSRVNAIGKRIHACLYSQADPDDVKKVFYEPVNDIQTIINELTHQKQMRRIAVVRDAGHVVLMKK